MTIDRKRLAHLLGMIGPNADGEALNAARLAEKLRKSSGLTWTHLLNECVRTITVEKIVEKRVPVDRIVEKIVEKVVEKKIDATQLQLFEARIEGFKEGWTMAMEHVSNPPDPEPTEPTEAAKPEPEPEEPVQETQWEIYTPSGPPWHQSAGYCAFTVSLILGYRWPWR